VFGWANFIYPRGLVDDEWLFVIGGGELNGEIAGV